MKSTIFVVGHVNPDTDSIASAIGYAWLLRERDGLDAVAARAGTINQQTAWILKLLGLEPPILINDASPRFDSVVRRLDSTTKGMPLKEAWAIATRTGGVAPVMNPDGTPLGLITGKSLFNFIMELVGVNTNSNEILISNILEYPCEEAANQKVLKFNLSTKIKDVIDRILREENDEFFVVDEFQRYVGICRQRDLLNPPRIQLIMVDHNEAQQSVASHEEAELLEILDHHRLGIPSTHTPIRVSVEIVGSTSTLVSERIENSGMRPPAAISGLLLAGILSDTLNLSSPTTTERDHKAASWLARWSLIKGSPLEGETQSEFGKKVLAASAGLSERSAHEVVNTDLKIYSAGSILFAIAQAEVSDLNEVTEHLPQINEALDALREKRNVNFAILMVTDIVRGNSKLILSNAPAILDELPYIVEKDNTRFASGVVSRKKQLLPVVLGILEG